MTTSCIHTALPVLVSTQNARRRHLASTILSIRRSVSSMLPPPLLRKDRILASLVSFVENGIEDFEFVTVRLREEKVDLKQTLGLKLVGC